ncbi:MAG: hypothetical protein ABFD54_11455 [Armatimonadota bacterium]
MPIKFNDLVNETVKATVLFDEDGQDQLVIEMKRGFYTPVVSARIGASDSPIQTQVEIMADSIVAWDLFDDKNKPMPINVETLSKLSIYALNKIYEAMLGAVLPNPAKGSS